MRPAAWALVPTAAILLLWLTAIANAAPRVAVNDEPVCGSFAFTWLPEELRQAQATGINLVFCYEKKASTQLLDPDTELGKIALQGNTKVMANFMRYAHGARLTKDAGPADTDLQIAGAGALPEAGILWVEDEAVAYSQRDDTGVQGAQRGAQGTTAVAHAVGTYLLEEGTLRDELDRWKASPNLWGFWVLDDKKGNHLPALRNLYRLIRKYDVDEDGRPYNHVVVAGFANVESLTNFGPDVCDAAGVYIYPSRRGTYHMNQPASVLQQMVPTIRERDPETATIGIYQAFHGPRWEPKPTPLQVRQQIDDFLRWGASGVMAYSWRMLEGYNTLRNLPDLREEVGRIAKDLREGRLRVDRTPPAIAPAVEMELVADHLIPLLTLRADYLLPRPSQGLSAELGPLEGADGTWLHLRFDRYEQGGNEWPGIGFNRGDRAFGIADWSAFSALVVRVANQLDTDSEIGVTIHGPAGMWARYYPLPAAATHDVAVNLGEVREAIATGHVARFGLIMRRPPVPTHFAVEDVYLAPMQFEALDLPGANVPRSGAQIVVDGAPEAAWDEAPELALGDGTGEPPLKPCSVRLLHDTEKLSVLFECAVPDPEQLKATTAEPDSSMPGEDVIEMLLRPKGQELTARLLVNAKGAMRDEMLTETGPDLAWNCGAEVASTLAEGRWTVELSLPLDALDGNGEGVWEANFRRADTELRPLAWVTEGQPGYEGLGALKLLQ